MKKNVICKKLQQGRSVYDIAITQSLPAAHTVIDDELCMTGFSKFVDKLHQLTPQENTQIEKQLQAYGKKVAVRQLLEFVHGKSESEIDEFINILRDQQMVSLAYFMEEMIERVKCIKNSFNQEETSQPTQDKINRLCKFLTISLKV